MDGVSKLLPPDLLQSITKAPPGLLKAIAGDLPKGDDQGWPAPPGTSDPQQVKRARAYLAKCEPAISGQGGHDRTFMVACALMHGFTLADEDVFALLTEWNATCQPPWSEKELQHKVKQARAKGSFEYKGPATGGKAASKATPTIPPLPSLLESRAYSKVTPRDLEWLWTHVVPLGKLTILDGDPDLGKSTVLFDLAARVSQGGTMPDGSQGLAGHVLILSAEDDEEDTIIHRLMADDADLDRCHTLTAVNGEPPRIPAHIDALEQLLEEHDIRLLVIDPLTAYLDAEFISDQKVRMALHPFTRMLQRRRCACTALRHLNKGGGTKALYRGGGSIAIIAAARAGLVVAQDPDDPKARVLAQTKHNLGPDMPSLRYKLEWIESQHACRVAWIPGGSQYKADDLLKPPEDKTQKSQTQEAREFLSSYLADGPKLAKQCFEAAQEHKITSAQAIKDAKADLGVVSTPIKELGVLTGWQWSLPPTPSGPLGGTD